MIIVGMADHHVTDVCRVESQGQQALFDGLLPVSDHHGFHQNDAFGCCNRPRRDIGHSEIVEIVENLEWSDAVGPKVIHCRGAATSGCSRSRGMARAHRRRDPLIGDADDFCDVDSRNPGATEQARCRQQGHGESLIWFHADCLRKQPTASVR
jgi:hypothetical protein